MVVVKMLLSVMLLLTVVDAFSIEDHLQAEKEYRQENQCLFDIPLAGGNRGILFSDWSLFMSSGSARISQFSVKYGDYVNCFGLSYGNSDGGCHGSTEGTLSSVALASDEYITEISGTAGQTLNKLTIVTNKETYGPYGRHLGGEFSVDFAGKRLAFISGRKGNRLNYIGLHFFC